MATCSAYWASGGVGIEVSVPVEGPSVIGLAVLIITVCPMVSLVLLVLLIHIDDVFLVCLYSDSRNYERCVLLKDCRIEGCKRCTVKILLSDWWYNPLALAVHSIADELLPVIIISIRARVVMTRGIDTPSAKIVCAISVGEVAGAGLVFRHV